MLISIVILTIVVALLVIYTVATQNDADPVYANLMEDIIRLEDEVAYAKKVIQSDGNKQSTFDLKVILRDETAHLIKDATSYVFKYREADGYVRELELLQVYKDGNEGNNAFAVFVYDEVSAVIKEDD